MCEVSQFRVDGGVGVVVNLGYGAGSADVLPLTLCLFVRISPVALRLGSEMDPYRRDLMNILHSYLVSDSFGPVLGARA